MIARFADECLGRYPSECRIVVDLQQDNVASWKALEAAGFRRAWAGDSSQPIRAIEDPASSTSLDRDAP